MLYHESLPHQLRSEIARIPVAYLPWGSHEWHGPHNPVGCDGVKAGMLAAALCDELGGVVFPTIYCGHSTVGPKGFDYCVEFSEPTISAVARESLNGIAAMGFRVIVVILGHWGSAQGGLIRKEVASFNASHEHVKAWAVQEDEMIESFGGGEDDHGGAEETSFMQLALPEAVDTSRLPSDRNISFQLDGILGKDPRRAGSAAHGEQLLAEYVASASARIRGMLES